MDDPIYPTVTPLEGVGTLVHTGAIMTQGRCNESLVEFLAPRDGAITMVGSQHQSRALRDFKKNPSVSETYVFFGGADYAAKSSIVTFGRNFPDTVRQDVEAVIERVAAIYSANAPLFVAPHVFASYQSQSPVFDTNFSGSVSSDKGIVSLNFFKDSPVPATDLLQATRFVAHEFAHVTQPEIGLADDPNWAAVLEGNAETIALLTVANLNPEWALVVADKLESAVNACLIEVGATVWRDSTRRTEDRIPYDCGVAFNVASILAVPSDDKFLPLHHLLAKNNQSAIAALDFLHSSVAVQLLGNNSVQAWLPDMLMPIAREGVSATQRLGNDSKRALIGEIVKDLIATDCSEGGGWAFETHFELAGVAGCKKFSEGMKVAALNGASLTSDPVAALRLARETCAVTNEIRVGLVDGTTIAIRGCRAGFRDIKPLALDASRLFRPRGGVTRNAEREISR